MGMAYEQLKNAALPHVVSEVVSDLADLFQKEMRLARAELSAKLSTKLFGGVWMFIAGVVALIAGLLVIQAIVFAIASYGIALHWSCLIVAGAFGLIAAAAYFKGRAELQAELAPTRTIHNIKRDISTAKEQLT